MSSVENLLETYAHQKTVLLTTYRKDGTPIGTPVNIAVEGDHAYIRTWDTAWKFRRLRRNPEAEIAPSTLRGTPTGAAIRVHARILEGAESTHAATLLAHKYPFLHGVLVPLIHRLRHNQTKHIELVPVER